MSSSKNVIKQIIFIIYISINNSSSVLVVVVVVVVVLLFTSNFVFGLMLTIRTAVEMTLSYHFDRNVYLALDLSID